MAVPAVLGTFCPTCGCPLAVYKNGSVKFHRDADAAECPVRRVDLARTFRIDGSDPAAEEDWRHVRHQWELRRVRRIHRKRAPERAAKALQQHQCGYRTEYEALKRQLAQPPAGWFVFGSHVDVVDVKLEFWGDEGGVPIWERLVR